MPVFISADSAQFLLTQHSLNSIACLLFGSSQSHMSAIVCVCVCVCVCVVRTWQEHVLVCTECTHDVGMWLGLGGNCPAGSMYMHA